MNTTVTRSSDKNVLKFVFTGEDVVAEAVMYKYPTFEERTVICVSTQSGCPVGCRFCGAGDYFARSLTADEIVQQVDYCLWSQDVDTTKVNKLQIMFMSMGEPWLNMENLRYAISMLHIKYPKADLLVSTMGPKIDYKTQKSFFDLAELIPTIGLQFSVHQSTDENRNKLIPYPNKHTLKEIAELGHLFYVRTLGRKVFINYCATEHNTTDEDAERLAQLFAPYVFEITISVVCERDETVKSAHDRQVQFTADFQQKLIDKGFSTRMFNPGGQDDVGGGCGQLFAVQKWMNEHPDKAKRSIGYGKFVVHQPS